MVPFSQKNVSISLKHKTSWHEAVEHYYPTFNIKLPDGVMDVALHLKKKNSTEGKVEVVWSLNITLTGKIVLVVQV